MFHEPKLSNDIFDTIQVLLEEGKKQEALKLAMENKLYAMGVILASHISKEVYGETVQTFSVQYFGNAASTQNSAIQLRNNPALCVLFTLLGGSKQPQCSFIPFAI